VFKPSRFLSNQQGCAFKLARDVAPATRRLRATVQLVVSSCCDHTLRPCICLRHPMNHALAMLVCATRTLAPLLCAPLADVCNTLLLRSIAIPGESPEVIIARLTPTTSTRAEACACWHCSGPTGLSLRRHAAGDTLCRCMYTCTVCSDLALACTSLQSALPCLYSQRNVDVAALVGANFADAVDRG
jgi:hypothetical protein